MKKRSLKKNFLLIFVFFLAAEVYHPTFSYEKINPVIFAYSEDIDYGLYRPLVKQTISELRDLILPNQLFVKRLTREELTNAIKENQIDLFMSSSSLYRQMIRYGAQDIGTALSVKASDPNQSEGSVFLVKGNRFDLLELKDVKGGTIGTSSRFGAASLEWLLGELLEHGIRERQIKLIRSYNPEIEPLLRDLKEEKLDVVVLPTCFIEWTAEQKPVDSAWVRVLSPKQYGSLSCLHSSNLYPNITLASLPRTPPFLIREITLSLLELKPEKMGGFYWSVASEFNSVDKVLFELEMDAWAADRKWSLKKFFLEFWPIFLASLILLFVMAVHGFLVEIKVRKKTRELKLALVRQEKLRFRATQISNRLEKIQKIAILGQLTSIFSHELAQPLNNIVCYAYPLINKLNQNSLSMEKIKLVLKEIIEQTQKAEAIVSRTRDYFRSEKNNHEIIDLATLTLKTIREYLISARNNVQIKENLQGCFVYGNSLELELIIINLLRNADEAQKAKEKKIFISLVALNSECKLIVEDKGPKLDQSVLETIRNMNSNKPEGLGLGLMIVTTLVERHGGKIDFERSSFGGLKVVITLPLIKNKSPEK